MKLERNLTEKQIKRARKYPSSFFVEESKKLLDYLMREGYMGVSPENPVCVFIVDIKVYPTEKKLRAILSDMTKEEALIEVTYDDVLKCYNVFALLPGMKEEDINYSIDGNVLAITAGKYKGKVTIPDNIVEVSKVYKNGVFTLRLT